MKWLEKIFSATEHWRAFLIWCRYVPVTDDVDWTRADEVRLKEFLTQESTGIKLRLRLLNECHVYDRTAPQKHDFAMAAGFCMGARALRSKLESWAEVEPAQSLPPQMQGITQHSNGPVHDAEASAGEALRNRLQPI